MRQSIGRERLADQLRTLHKGIGLADESKIERQAPLLLLAAERMLAIENAEQQPLIPRALRLISDALRGLSPDDQAILGAGLNLERRPDVNLTRRLQDLAASTGRSDPRSLTAREKHLYQPLADFILEEVEVARARGAQEALAAGDGDATAAALFVAEQFRYYYRIFTPMSGVGADLEAYLAWRFRVPDGPWPDHLLDAAIWQCARWEVALERFIQDLGGNWIASSPDAEADLVELQDVARRRLPFGDWDASLLRLALLGAPHGEREPFEQHLRDRKLQRRYRDRMRTWTLRCDCNLRRPKKSCEPHQVIRAIQDFTILVDREWYRLANWYHLPPEHVSAEREDVLNYFLHADPENFDLARMDRLQQSSE